MTTLPTHVRPLVRLIRDWLRLAGLPALVIPADGEPEVVEARTLPVEALKTKEAR